MVKSFFSETDECTFSKWQILDSFKHKDLQATILNLMEMSESSLKG